MINIIYGYYNPENPLLDNDNVDVDYLPPSFAKTYEEAIITASQKDKNYNLYIHQNKKLLNNLKKEIDNNPTLKQKIILIYDNGNKYWQMSWDNVKSIIKQAKIDEGLGLL